MMDVFRILLSLGLVVLLWRLDVRGIRPVRNFILWGVDYPFHFLLTATLILVIWGVIGSGFGLQGLFLDEDPLTQVLLGATVMLLFSFALLLFINGLHLFLHPLQPLAHRLVADLICRPRQGGRVRKKQESQRL
jgi:hypothetical protein